MAATKNTLAALWGKKLQDERKTKSSDHGSVISTRSRAPEDKNAHEKEATSRLSKPEEQASGPIELPAVPIENVIDAKKPEEQEDQRKRKRAHASKEQLEEFFAGNANPSAAEKASLAEQSDLTVQQVSTWFGNRRKKARLAQAAQADGAAGPAAAQAPEPIIIDDEDADMAAEDMVESSEHAARTAVAEPAACMPEQQAGPPATPAAVCSVHREEQIKQLKEEIAELESYVTSRPHPIVTLDFAKFEFILQKSQVGIWLVGCSLPLSEATEKLWYHCKGDYNPGSPLTKAAIRNMIIEVAARKSYAAKDAGSDKVDALEDTTASFLWQWEVRDQKYLPVAHRNEGIQHKKQMRKVAARLTALAAACKALEGKGTDKQVAKALAKLDKLEKPLLSPAAAAADSAAENPSASQPAPAVGLSQPQEAAGALPQAPDTAAAAEPAAATLPSQGGEGTPGADASSVPAADKEADEAEKAKPAQEKQEADAQKELARLEKQKAAEEKERARIEAAREKERQRLEKEAQKKEKEAEKERQRAAKEAEKERQRAEKEAAKTGFESRDALCKSRNLMNRFFKTPAKTGGEAEGGSSQPLKTPMSALPLRHPFHEIFTPAPESARLPVPEDISAAFDEAIAAAKQRGVSELEEGMQHIRQSWKSRPRHKRIRGLPPSWARMRTAEEHVAEFGRLEKARLWRRKFLWFAASKRPAYYGSWSAASPTVTGRRPLARDDALDYEVMSDEEWEEEPEGENLSDDDMEEEEDEAEDSCGDGFVVPNGYISDDEGVASVQQDLDDLAAELDDEATGAEVAAGGDAVQRDRLRLLNAALDRATRANRPIIITRLPMPPAPSQDSARPAHLTGDPALLSALQPLVLTTKVKIRMLPPPETEDAPGDVAADGAAGPATARGRGRAAAQEQEELTPDLVQFLLSHPELKAVAKVAKAFTEAHPDRKVVKKWVHNKVKDIAEHSGGAWVIKQSSASAQQPADAEQSPASTPLQPRPSSADQPPLASHPAGEAATSAAVTPATAGPLDRFLRAGSQPQATPQPQRAAAAAAVQGLGEVVILDEDEGAPAPMDVDAPPAAAAAQTPSTKDEIRGTADPFWRGLAESIAANSLQVAEQLQRGFKASAAGELVRAVPSFVLTAMVKGLASGQCSRLLQSCLLKALAQLLRLLVAAGDTSNRVPTPTKVFRDERSAPVAVSLDEMLACRSLLGALQACMRAKQNRMPQVAQPAAQLLAAMLAVGAAELGTPAAGSQESQQPSLAAAAIKEAAELRLHVARDDAWHVLFTELLGPTSDASVVECVAKTLGTIGRDAAAARTLLQRYSDIFSDKELHGKLQKLLLAASAVATKHRQKRAMEDCLSFLGDLLSLQEADGPVRNATAVTSFGALLRSLEETVSAHIPSEPADPPAGNTRCLLAALKVGAFAARFATTHKQCLSAMQRSLPGPIAAHESVWEKLQVADIAQALLAQLSTAPPQ